MKLKSFELEPGTLAGKFGIVAVRIYTLEVRQLVIYCDNYVLQDGKLWQVSPPRLARTLKLLFYMQNGRRANNRKKTSYPNRIVVNSFLVKPVTSDCV